MPDIDQVPSTTYAFELATVLPATPESIYAAWLSSAGHSAMTGAQAHVDGRVGGAYDAWDGYITGTTLALEPDHRIVQSWRTLEFGPDHADSHVDVQLDAEGGGTRLTLRHSNVPSDQRGYEEGGWLESYFEPMRVFFSGE